MNSEHFVLLLPRLHPDPERAAEEYEFLRLKLSAYFQLRGCHHPEECADEALDRVARKIAEGEDVGQVLAYAYGVARYVLLEYWNRHNRVPQEISPSVPSSTNLFDEVMKRERMDCFRRCLKELDPVEARILLQYWVHDEKSNREARRDLAEELGITPGALRLRIMRIRARFMACYQKCAGSPQKR